MTTERRPEFIPLLAALPLESRFLYEEQHIDRSILESPLHRYVVVKRREFSMLANGELWLYVEDVN